MSMLVELNEIGVRIPSILPDNLFELNSPRPADRNNFLCIGRYRYLDGSILLLQLTPL